MVWQGALLSDGGSATEQLLVSLKTCVSVRCGVKERRDPRVRLHSYAALLNQYCNRNQRASSRCPEHKKEIMRTECSISVRACMDVCHFNYVASICVDANCPVSICAFSAYAGI